MKTKFAAIVLFSFISFQIMDRPVCLTFHRCDDFTYTTKAWIHIEGDIGLWGIQGIVDSIIYGNSGKNIGHTAPVMFTGGVGLSKNWDNWRLIGYGTSDHLISEDGVAPATMRKPYGRTFNYLEIRREF